MNPKDLVGAKKSPLGLVPVAGAIMSAPAHLNGANKYGAFNWRKQPVQAMTYVEAIQRHLAAWVDGQDNAEDTGIHHFAHAIAGLNILADAMGLGILIDNRPPKGPAADMLREQDHSAIPVPDIEELMSRTVTYQGMSDVDWQAYGVPTHDYHEHHEDEDVMPGADPRPVEGPSITSAELKDIIRLIEAGDVEAAMSILPPGTTLVMEGSLTENPVAVTLAPDHHGEDGVTFHPTCPACGAWPEHTLACPYWS